MKKKSLILFLGILGILILNNFVISAVPTDAEKDQFCKASGMEGMLLYEHPVSFFTLYKDCSPAGVDRPTGYLENIEMGGCCKYGEDMRTMEYAEGGSTVSVDVLCYVYNLYQTYQPECASCNTLDGVVNNYDDTVCDIKPSTDEIPYTEEGHCLSGKCYYSDLWYIDVDRDLQGDNHADPHTVPRGTEIVEGYSINNDDCDDGNRLIQKIQDVQTTETPLAGLKLSFSYSSSVLEDVTVTKGVCGDWVDNDCDGLIDCKDISACAGERCSMFSAGTFDGMCTRDGNCKSDLDRDGVFDSIDCDPTDPFRMSPNSNKEILSDSNREGYPFYEPSSDILLMVPWFIPLPSDYLFCGDGKDNDCDGLTDCEDEGCDHESCKTSVGDFGLCCDLSCRTDRDNDGFVSSEGDASICGMQKDCDDFDAETYPGSTEKCGTGTDDEDCDGFSNCADSDCENKICGAVSATSAYRCVSGSCVMTSIPPSSEELSSSPDSTLSSSPISATELIDAYGWMILMPESAYADDYYELYESWRHPVTYGVVGDAYELYYYGIMDIYELNDILKEWILS